MRQFLTLSETKAPFWMARLIIHGLLMFLCLVIIVNAASAAADQEDNLEWVEAIVVAVPAAIGFCYNFPQWVAVIVDSGHRGIPPLPVFLTDLLFFLVFTGITIFLAATQQYSNAFENKANGRYYARVCVIATPFAAALNLILAAIGAYDIYSIRKAPEQAAVNVVTGYPSVADLSQGLHPQSYGALPVRPVSPAMAASPRGYTRVSRSSFDERRGAGRPLYSVV